MKQPVYLYKIVENPDKIIVRYMNFGDVRNGAIAFDKSTGKAHSRLLIRGCVDAFEVDGKAERLLAGFSQKNCYPQSFCKDGLYFCRVQDLEV
ncbi:hypothetical protein AM501_11475 [Aneurinibacillus migulanus]|uniref:hypothetical protein n=1 Tax=Aneurinibacillus migulanus TaxID=47500 RepID=UPI0005BDA3CF|nr:hypothetical protein [Aneurinibacillus migulanus]KIV58521.1 hypothetical protein TS64_04665 [Aneurinibacillus migulanus]KPD08165.1 hypothetical protein AM501_11475 [Aneurinibacillus migulanus]